MVGNKLMFLRFIEIANHFSGIDLPIEGVARFRRSRRWTRGNEHHSEWIYKVADWPSRIADAGRRLGDAHPRMKQRLNPEARFAWVLLVFCSQNPAAQEVLNTS